MSVYYRELMKGTNPNPDSVCRICGHALEDHEFLGDPDSEARGKVGKCTRPGCNCKKFQPYGEPTP